MSYFDDIKIHITILRLPTILSKCTHDNSKEGHIMTFRRPSIMIYSHNKKPTRCTISQIYFYKVLYMFRRPGSSVGIATDYGLDGPGIESRWGRDFPPVQTGPGAHPASCTMGTGSFPGVKCGRGVLLTTHPLLAPRSWKDRAIPLLPLWATNRPVTGLLFILFECRFFCD